MLTNWTVVQYIVFTFETGYPLHFAVLKDLLLREVILFPTLYISLQHDSP
jgi:hypothetical protein